MHQYRIGPDWHFDHSTSGQWSSADQKWNHNNAEWRGLHKITSYIFVAKQALKCELPWSKSGNYYEDFLKFLRYMHLCVTFQKSLPNYDLDVTICVPTWGTLRQNWFWVIGKNMSKGQNEQRSKFFIFDIFFLNIHQTKHNHDKHFFQWKCWRKEVLGNINLLFDGSLEVHIYYNLWQPKSL